MNHPHYPQNLPTYIHDFEHAEWLVTKKGIYTFHYMKNSVAEKDIDHIIDIQLKSCEKISEFIGLTADELPKNIDYYFYPDTATKKRLMGDNWYAQSIYNERRVHMLYTDNIQPIGPHEDTHILSLQFGLAIGFIQEGLAEYMVGHDWYGNDLVKTVREGLHNKSIFFIPELLYNHDTWLHTDDVHARYFYALAGTFVGFLIRTYSKEKFLDLYRKLSRTNSDEENKALYMNIFNMKSGDLLKKYLLML